MDPPQRTPRRARPAFAIPAPRMSAGAELQAVKVCGVVSAADAALVLRVAREELPSSTELMVGMILWPGSRRSVRAPVGASIAGVVRGGGAVPVGVFVDESAAEMEAVCEQCGVGVAQLHGAAARRAVREGGFSGGLRWIDVVDVESDGSLGGDRVEEGDVDGRVWTLYDAKGGGTGKPFDWRSFRAPPPPWLLAGGLDPDNVAEAVVSLRPTGIDVASGVAKDDLCRKDEERLRLFLRRAMGASRLPVIQR